MHCNLFRYFRFARCEIFSFPDHFSFGASSAAYQIDKNFLNRSILMKFNNFVYFLQGGWNLDGKSPSVWDEATHNRPEMIADRSNGDISADSYHFYKEDVKALKQVGVGG